MEYLTNFFSGAAGAALVAGIFSLIQRHHDGKSAIMAGVRYLLLYNIQERAMQDIKAGEISLEETNPQYRHIIQQRVEERRAAEERRKNGPISDQEALDIIYGGK